MALHNEEAPELGDPNTFLRMLRARFRDDTQVRQAEFEIHTIKQGSRPVIEYIHEFWRLAGKLRHWLERLLVYYFQDGLNRELYHMCLPQEIPE